MSRISRTHLLRVRASVSVVVGALVGVSVAPGLGVAAGILACWGALALVNTVWVLLVVWPMDATQTRSHATAEDPGRRVARIIAVVGSLMSLAAVLVVVVQARHEQGITQFLLAGVAVASVAASWAVIQVDYMLRYARLYYKEPIGGIAFGQEGSLSTPTSPTSRSGSAWPIRSPTPTSRRTRSGASSSLRQCSPTCSAP